MELKATKTEIIVFEFSSEGKYLGFSAKFFSKSPFLVSVFWDINKELLRVVHVLKIGEDAKIKTFDGYVFLFRRIGTRHVLHKSFVMSLSQTSSARIRIRWYSM